MSEDLQDQKVIVYDPELCTGCRYCEIACSFKHHGAIDVNKSYVSVLFTANNGSGRFEAAHCYHCEDAVCVSVCPSEALKKDEETGWVKTNQIKCIGCKMCVYSCPLSIPVFIEEKKAAMKCDFCDGDPECVKHCSSQALKIVPREKAVKLNEKIYVGAD